MNKWLLFLLTIIIICFSGCGNGKQTNSDPSNQKKLQEDKETVETTEKEDNKEKNQNTKNEQSSTIVNGKSEKGKKETESTSSNESSVDNNSTEPVVVEDNRPYIGYEGNCSVCGADGRDVYISREGMCDSCFNQMYPNGLYGRCTVCGVELTNGEAIAHGDRCDNCAKCDSCGVPLDYNYGNGWICQSCLCATIPCPICGTIGVEPATGVCYTCSYGSTVTCSVCGVEIDESASIDGMCSSCYEASLYRIENYEDIIDPSLNIVCPYCSYSWPEMGVGTDGVWCPSCGQNFMP